MPRDDDAWRRRREREDEETAQQQPTTRDGSAEKLDELIGRAEPMIEQLNNLYNQYLSGAEKVAPIERRKQLDQVMDTVMLMGKPTPALQFRATTLQQKYLTHRERWDRMIKDLESGKIKRTVGGPKR